MEVTVLEARNIPKKPVIAVRTGSSLRHADLTVNKPFHVPLRGLQDGQMKVTLYQQLGTQTIPDADETESICNVPVRTPDGACSQVKLRIRRGQQVAVTGPNFKSSSIAVEDYLNHHQLEARIQNLFELVLKRQPEDPYRCMIEELHKIKSTSEESADMDTTAQSALQLAPVPPTGPPPKNARPSPAAKGRNLASGQSQAELDTKAALAEIMSAKERGSVYITEAANARVARRYDANKALSNLELAHEVMRLVIRQIVAGMASQSSSLGSSRLDQRAWAIEHAKNVEISHVVMTEVMKGAYVRFQARSLGFLGGGHSQSDDVSYLNYRDPVEATEHKALTAVVVKDLLRTAFRML